MRETNHEGLDDSIPANEDTDERASLRPGDSEELPSFTELTSRAQTESGIDLALIEELGRQGPVRYNGGIRCDVSRGPCACGAWH